MKIQGRVVKVPKWISCRTYHYGKENSRTYISNERTHSFVQLDGLASDMWKMLLDEVQSEVFVNWANANNVLEQVDDFLYDLKEQNLILFCDKEEYNQNDCNVIYGEISDNSKEQENEFIVNMQNWYIENNFLFSIFFELTYRCDLKCVHCYNPKDMNSVEIDFDKCKQIIDDAYKLGCFKVIFSGGECTLHSKFIDIIKYARSKRMSVEIFTNGQTVYSNQNLYNDLLQEYPYRICVSLYSTEKNIHERVTNVKNSFDKTMSFIKQMRKDNVNVQIKNFLLNLNCNDCIKVKNFAKKINATSIADLSLIPTINGDKKTFDYAVDDDDLFELYIDKNSPLYIGNKYKRNIEKIMNDSPCLAGYTALSITPNLDVTLCVSMPLVLSNLRDNSIVDIWQGLKENDINNKLYKWHQITNADFKECFKEEYCKFCDFCPGMGYLENGYLKKSDILCKQAKAKMKAFKYLEENNLV